MRLRPTLFRMIPAGLTFALTIAVGIGAISNAANAADTLAAAKIQQVEFGIKNVFKVGYWTPVSVAVEGAQGNAEQRVDVTVVDNDGVPTVAGATAKVAGGGA